MLQPKKNPVGSLRHIADILIDNEITDGYMEYLSRSTVTDVAKAKRAYDEWHARNFPCEKDGTCARSIAANEISNIVGELCRTHEQSAFEDGMKASAKLVLELLGK